MSGIQTLRPFALHKTCCAYGRSRDEDCSSPPTQIRAGGFPAPGSRLRSHLIGLRGMGYALCPGHASQLALPSTGRLRSTISAGDVARHCSRLPRYYAAVRLPLASAAAIGRAPPRNQPSTPPRCAHPPLECGLYVLHGWPGASCCQRLQGRPGSALPSDCRRDRGRRAIGVALEPDGQLPIIRALVCSVANRSTSGPSTSGQG